VAGDGAFARRQVRHAATDVGADWKSFRDLPHFAIKKARTRNTQVASK
jgi:hypothetical protein